MKDRKCCGRTSIAVSQSVEIARYISPPEETHDLGFDVSIGRLQEIIETQRLEQSYHLSNTTWAPVLTECLHCKISYSYIQIRQRNRRVIKQVAGNVNSLLFFLTQALRLF